MMYGGPIPTENNSPKNFFFVFEKLSNTTYVSSLSCQEELCLLITIVTQLLLGQFKMRARNINNELQRQMPFTMD